MKARNSLQPTLILGVLAITFAACIDEAQLPTDTGASIVERPELGLALRIHNQHTPELMKIDGVVGTALAVDGSEPRIRVFTLHGGVGGVPARLQGIPVERIVTGMFVAGDVNDPTTKERPAPNGFSIGHPAITAGTFGAVVRDGAGVCYALSNNHVLANANDASIGDNVLQPGPFDGGSNPSDAIGTLSAFEEIAFDGSSNTIDAAIAVLTNPADATGSTPSYAYGAPGSSTVDPSIFMDVEKFGRTTGYTTGEITETNVTVDVCYETRGPFRCVAAARFTDQIGISPGSFSDGGDSGSLIVRSSDKSPVGLLYAGSSTRTLANPIGDVLSHFNVSIETNMSACAGGGTPSNQAPTADFTWSANGLTVDFTDTSFDNDGSVDEWSWDFGGGQTSTAQNPSHAFPASGTYSVELTVTDDDGAPDTASQNVTVSDGSGGDFTLAANGFKQRGRHTIDLTWSGATGTDVDIYLNGALLITTANDGEYQHTTSNRGGGTYTYEVCEAGGTSTCSNEAVVVFG